MNFRTAAKPATPQESKSAELPASGVLAGGGAPANELAATMKTANATKPTDNFEFFIRLLF